MSNEKLNNHVDVLKKKHYNIQLEINRLKKEKLRIKDELENCERKLS